MKIQSALLITLITYLILLMFAYLNKVRAFVVTSNSMKPEFEFGDLLLAKSQEQYLPQDIISYKIENEVVTHRIVSIHKLANQEQIFKTKGDGNKSSDLRFINKEQIIGKVVFIIPKLGYLILFIQSKLLKLSFIFFLNYLLAKLVFNQLKLINERGYEK